MECVGDSWSEWIPFVDWPYKVKPSVTPVTMECLGGCHQYGVLFLIVFIKTSVAWHVQNVNCDSFTIESIYIYIFDDS